MPAMSQAAQLMGESPELSSENQRLTGTGMLATMAPGGVARDQALSIIMVVGWAAGGAGSAP